MEVTASMLAHRMTPKVAAQTLADRVATATLDAAETRAIGRELLDALAHAHRLGVIHRDIKPANIFLHAGHALLADFGVAAITDSSSNGLTDAGVCPAIHGMANHGNS